MTTGGTLNGTLTQLISGQVCQPSAFGPQVPYRTVSPDLHIREETQITALTGDLYNDDTLRAFAIGSVWPDAVDRFDNESALFAGDASAFGSGGDTGAEANVLILGGCDLHIIAPFDAFGEEDFGNGFRAMGYGPWWTFAENGNAVVLDGQVDGFFPGMDFTALSDMRFGPFSDYGYPGYAIDINAAKTFSDDFMLRIFGGGDVGALYALHDISRRRHSDFSTLSRKITGSYNAGTIQLYGGISYPFDVTGSFQLEPFLNATYIHQESNAFTQKGGYSALNYMNQMMDTIFTTFGLRGVWAFPPGSSDSNITASAGWQHAYGNINPRAVVAFTGGNPFVMAGAPLVQDQAVFSVGWQARLRDNVSFRVTHTSMFGSHFHRRNITAMLEVSF